ncbi:MAG: ABC transporter substrate-binding protein [Methylocystis sp.]|nr:ABC transporter substrate-binding protein [Methylocystis sp.]MCA3584914.1 ABC transporter substrate-binding protein [Methylocystis sp.]MCA3589483.1 ABC transporter substrate-binding protein [Methylocystis sp.]MCA3591132.1 ABC transporter substrate-binding protein [Methylocystis sp.]
MLKKLIAAASLAALVAGAGAANAQQTLRYAFQGNLNTLDPHSLNETTTLGLQGNVYEGLTARDKDLRIVPGLAERWEVLDNGLRWRFYLRKGVKFHNGNDFNADDVVFSTARTLARNSQLAVRLPRDIEAVKVDDYTVDFKLKTPNPILHYSWDTWYMMDKEWTEANNATQPSAPQDPTPSFAVLNANGTGAFRISEHQLGVRTVFEKNPNWWQKSEHNLDRVIFTPITSAPTRVAALLSGEVDIIDPVPLQDVARINASPNARVLEGPEIRTIYMGFDQMRPELTASSVKGKNPFKDMRVRKAFYQAVEIEAIKRQVMRNAATPASSLISPLLFPQVSQIQRHPFDVAAANKLLDEAGYPRGADGTRFEVDLDCPNDRYVNDGPICQAVTAMLARIGIKINLLAVPRAQFFAKANSPVFNTPFYLLGWTPGTMDAHNVLNDLMMCRTPDGSGGRGQFNNGGYCNPKVDELALKVLVEIDTAKRDAMILEAFKILHEDVGYIPLHQQALAWGVSKNVDIVQRADNQPLFYWATKK